MRDESEWRRLSNAFPTSLQRSVSEGVPACVYFCERAKKKTVGVWVWKISQRDEEHCLRRALVMPRAASVDFWRPLKLPPLFQPN